VTRDERRLLALYRRLNGVCRRLVVNCARLLADKPWNLTKGGK
jgi:hypothetical protein